MDDGTQEKDTGQGSKEKQGRGARVGGSAQVLQALTLQPGESSQESTLVWPEECQIMQLSLGSYVKLPAFLWFSRN